MLLAIFLILFVYLKNQFLNTVARDLVFVEKSRADAQVQRVVAFFLWRTFSETTALASETELDYVWRLRCISTAQLDDPFHVDPLSPDQPSRDLKVFVVLDLDVKATSVLNRWAAIVVSVCVERRVGGKGLCTAIGLKDWLEIELGGRRLFALRGVVIFNRGLKSHLVYRSIGDEVIRGGNVILSLEVRTGRLCSRRVEDLWRWWLKVCWRWLTHVSCGLTNCLN